MKIFKFISISFINFYQCCIGKMIPHKCAFVPCCSEYTKIAILRFGTLKGIFLGVKRIIKCNPSNRGKIDLVPQNIKGEYKWLI